MRLLRFLPRFRTAYQNVNRAADRETLTRSNIEAHQVRSLNSIWQAACQHVPYYAKLSQELGLPRQFQDLEEFSKFVPVCSRETVRTNPDAFLSRQPAPGQWLYTGGSTGVPTPTYWEHAARAQVLSRQYRFHAIWGVDIFDRKAFLWGHAASFAPGVRGRIAKLRVPIEDYLRNRLRLSAYKLGGEDLKAYLLALQSFRPAMLYGYSSAVYVLAQAALAEGTIIPSLKVIVLTAEPAFPEMVQLIQRAFGVPAVQEYGSVDAGLVAYEDQSRNLRVREDIVVVETLPVEDGRHKILVSTLTNPSFPLFRYEIGDLTSRPLIKPLAGFSTLFDVLGRTNDFLITKSGRRVHPESVTHIVKHHAPAIRRFRAHQAKDGALTLFLETQPGAPLDSRHLEGALRNILENQAVQIVPTQAIDPNQAGKHRWVVSEAE